MAGEKRFRGSLFGYKKQDVYNFIEKLAKDLEEQIKTKDDELADLRSNNQDLKKQIEELTGKLHAIEGGRTYIANAIIKAEEQAKNIIDDAIEEAEQRKNKLQGEIDEYNDELEKVKKELKDLRIEAMSRIKKYEMQLMEIVDSGNDAEDEAAAAIEEMDAAE
ncbi:MAG: DivIVA domain-containing protein [Clostridia bacterium]